MTLDRELVTFWNLICVLDATGKIRLCMFKKANSVILGLLYLIFRKLFTKVLFKMNITTKLGLSIFFLILLFPSFSLLNFRLYYFLALILLEISIELRYFQVCFQNYCTYWIELFLIFNWQLECVSYPNPIPFCFLILRFVLIIYSFCVHSFLLFTFLMCVVITLYMKSC